MTENVYSVSEINSFLKRLLDKEDTLRNVQVVGEISNFKRYPSGHAYFTLKDADAVLKCVMFRSRALGLRFEPRNGDTVIAVGRIAVYERDGVYQLYTDLLLQQGVGDLMQAYEMLKSKLLQEGLFDQERKQPLPVNPQRVGIITSPAGAAVRDIITVSRRRNPGVKLLLYPVQVQGENASAEIAAAIRFFNEKKLANVLIVGRGGGSIEDLWAFNEERTVRAVAGSCIPVVSAVGHETDFTLCDFAADQRAATPSQAAEMAVADIVSYRQRVRFLLERCRSLMAARLAGAQRTLEALASSWALRDPQRLLADKALRADGAYARLVQNMQRRAQQAQHALALQAARLDSMSPLAVLGRGYSVTQSRDYKLIGSVEQVQWGDELVTTVRDGQIISVVQQVEGR
ncbi:exodeoxyribonuclease VII large subunit [uncultured Phascolarctobacterium sp.]|uniref:exodeoxyribonuclease VII large subunit n=1 Tax=uncultured Phascolarctobacterium sp. TaxID=512296 RepID=UPI0025F2616E|nr:exodeoxyribonuclease VII large subunit [uncultured Phascolarctobacterium sp.]